MSVKNIFLTLLLLINLISPCLAFLARDHSGLDPNLMEVPQEINPDLNKRVDFAFKETKISDILMLLSKVAKFNVILPTEYDQKISITLTRQKVIDAIDDIAKLTKLNYEFKGNSVIFSNSDFNGVNFVSLPVAFYSAEDMVSALNDVLFRQLEISAAPGLRRPHAAPDPGKNAVIILGTDEQIEASKKFLAELDTADKVEIYTPGFLDFREIREIIKNSFPKEHQLKIKREEDNSILLKGNEKEVKEALSLIRSRDLPQDPVDLNLEVYALKPNSYEVFFAVNNSMKIGEPIKINPNIYELGKAPNVFKFLEKVDLKIIALKKDEKASAWGLSLAQRRDLLNQKIVVLSFDDKGEYRLAENESLFYLMDKDLLKTNKELKKLSSSSQPDFVLLKISVL